MGRPGIVVLAVAMAACFDPDYHQGLPCSTTGGCPSGQLCRSGVCFEVTPVAGEPCDAFEPNAPTAEPWFESSFPELGTGLHQSVGLCPAETDTDFFQLSVLQGSVVTVRIGGTGSTPLQVTLYDDNGVRMLTRLTALSMVVTRGTYILKVEANGVTGDIVYELGLAIQ